MKKLCSCLLSLALLCALAAVPASAAYSDVPSGSALASEVEKAVGYGLMNGYSAGTFGYADPMTRAQFVTVLDRMLLPQDGDTTLVGHITPEMQVEYDAVRAYYSSIDAAAEYGWVDTDEPFRPTDPITRGEMSEILVRALGLGGAAALKMALEEAGGCEDYSKLYINAHGTSTPLNDACETKAIKTALGEENARKCMISSTKSMTGHMLGAAGAVEAIFTVLSLRDSFLPPTIGYVESDPECDLDYVPNEGREAEVGYALSNSLGFGGHNACVLFKKWNG